MSTRSQLVRLERAQIDLETGEFPMVLATDGEASDGDILSIEGAQLPERAPLQNAHMNEATSTLGSVFGFRRELKSSPKKLRASGQIELEGEGAVSDIRRDIAMMISKGHLTGVSVRWEPLEWTPRVNLPKEHAAFVDGEREKDPRKRFGLFFKKWRVLEGSIAPVQADKQSLIGRAEETDGEVAEFWRELADAKPEIPTMPIPEDFESEFDFTRAALPVALAECVHDEDALILCESLWKDRTVDIPIEEPAEEELADEAPNEREEPVEGPSPEALAAVAAARMRELISELQLEPEAIAAIAADMVEPDPATLISAALERIDALEAQLAEVRDQDCVTDEPVPSLRTTDQMFDYLDGRMKESNQKALAMLQAVINMKRGKVVEGQTPRERLQAEAESLLQEMRRQEDEETTELDLGPMLLQLDRRLENARRRMRQTIKAGLVESSLASTQADLGEEDEDE
jgi:hypothetical protein